MPLYNKADSLAELRSADADATAALARIAGARDRLIATAADPVRAAIIARACAELEAAPHAGDVPDFALRPHVVAELQRISDDELGRYLFYRFRYDTLPRTHEVDAFPPCLQVEPTS